MATTSKLPVTFNVTPEAKGRFNAILPSPHTEEQLLDLLQLYEDRESGQLQHLEEGSIILSEEEYQQQEQELADLREQVNNNQETLANASYKETRVIELEAAIEQMTSELEQVKQQNTTLTTEIANLTQNLVGKEQALSDALRNSAEVQQKYIDSSARVDNLIQQVESRDKALFESRPSWQTMKSLLHPLVVESLEVACARIQRAALERGKEVRITPLQALQLAYIQNVCGDVLLTNYIIRESLSDVIKNIATHNLHHSFRTKSSIAETFKTEIGLPNME